MGKRKREYSGAERYLEEAVRLGHAEKSATGAYRLTPQGIHALARHQVFELLDQRHGAAFTFGALVTITGLKPNSIIAALVGLLVSGAIQMSDLPSFPHGKCFHRCINRNGLHLYGGENEEPGQPSHMAEVEFLMTLIACDESKSSGSTPS